MGLPAPPKYRLPNQKALRVGVPTAVSQEVALNNLLKEQFLRSRRAVVFRSADDEALVSGNSAVVSLHVVSGDGTTCVFDSQSTVILSILSGTGTVTAVATTFFEGVANITVSKTAPGDLVVGILTFTSGTEVELPIDITATKTYTG